MDMKETARTLGLEEGEFLEIVQLFVKVSQADLAAMEEAIQADDARRVFELSHSIKGSAVNLGFTDISDVARKMELEARQNSLSGVRQGFTILKQKINLLSDSI